MKKTLLKFITITFTIYFLFIFNSIIKTNTYNIFILCIKNIIPSLFPIIIITNYIKYNILNKSNNKNIKFISYLYTYTPSNAIISNNKKELLYSSIVNPLFSYSILINILNKKDIFILISTNMIIRYFFLYKNISFNNRYESNKNICEIINISFKTLFYIIGNIIFFNMLITLLNIFFNNNLLFFIEITNGFNIIKTIGYYKLKLLMSTFLNSFAGLGIYLQIKSINSDANYKYLINNFILSTIITFITFILILII